MSKLGKEGHECYFLNCLSWIIRQTMNSVYLLKYKKEENVQEADSQKMVGSSERESSFSLEFWAIRPSEFFGARRKAVLRGEAYVWAPILGSFVKLREVGVSPYLGFILYLSTLLMFELNEVVRGRLIGPKSLNRIVIIF